MLRSGTLRKAHFSFDKNACLLGKAGRSAFYAGLNAVSKSWLHISAHRGRRFKLIVDGISA